MNKKKYGRLLILAVLAGITSHTARAEGFDCPSADAVSYHVYVDAPSLEEALKQARASWDLRFVEKPEMCFTRDDYAKIYQAAFENSAMFQKMRQPIKLPTRSAEEQAAADKRCGRLPVEGDWKLLAVARVIDAPAGCDRTLSVEQQLFVGGVTSRLAEQCKIHQADQSWRVTKFLMLVNLGAVSGIRPVPLGRGPDAVLADSIDSQAESSTPYLAGALYTKALGDAACKGGLPKRWLEGLERYLDDTSDSASTPFIDTCVSFYRETVARGNCACVGEVLRISDPGIFRLNYDGDLLRNGTQLTGLGLPLLACGILRFDRPALPRPPASTGYTNANKMRDCRRFADQGMGTKVPEEAQALINRCMAAEDSLVNATASADREAETKKSEDYAALRARRLTNCENLAPRIKQNESGDNAAYAFGRRQRAFVMACSFREENTDQFVTAEPAEWCRQFDAYISMDRQTLRSSYSAAVEARLGALVESYRRNCDAGGDIVTGKAIPGGKVR